MKNNKNNINLCKQNSMELAKFFLVGFRIKNSKGENMDVKRVESIAVPTALAAVGGAVTGYIIPKMTRNGEMADEFVIYSAESMKAKDDLLLNRADSLDKITFNPSKKEVEKLVGKKNSRDKIMELYKKASERGNKQLEKFVMRNAEQLGIEKEKGQSLREAAKEYIKGKTIDEIKEAYLSSSRRDIIENTDYRKLMK